MTTAYNLDGRQVSPTRREALTTPSQSGAPDRAGDGGGHSHLGCWAAT
jgi:hypothetical protein